MRRLVRQRFPSKPALKFRTATQTVAKVIPGVPSRKPKYKKSSQGGAKNTSFYVFFILLQLRLTAPVFTYCGQLFRNIWNSNKSRCHRRWNLFERTFGYPVDLVRVLSLMEAPKQSASASPGLHGSNAPPHTRRQQRNPLVSLGFR